MSSITLTLTGNSSSLTTFFHPEIELDERYDYSCSLLDFHTYNSIPNVHDKNNKFYYTFLHGESIESKVIVVPVGSYELDDIAEFLNKALKKQNIDCQFLGNKNTMKCVLMCSNVLIDFTKNDCIGSVLGFGKRILSGEIFYEADDIVNIQNINSIRIDCDLTTGSFHNGNKTHSIYEFSPSVSPGYKITEQPRNLIYLPVVRHRINTINISIVDQNGNLVDFRGETITCRIHIKRDA